MPLRHTFTKAMSWRPIKCIVTSQWRLTIYKSLYIICFISTKRAVQQATSERGIAHRETDCRATTRITAFRYCSQKYFWVKPMQSVEPTFPTGDSSQVALPGDAKPASLL